MSNKKQVNGVKCRTETIKETTERIITWYTCDYCGHEENSIDNFYICDKHGVYCKECASLIDRIFSSCPRCYPSIRNLTLMNFPILKPMSGQRLFFEIVGFRNENIKVAKSFLRYYLSRSNEAKTGGNK